MFSCPVFVACRYNVREKEKGGGEPREGSGVKVGIGKACTDPFVEDLGPLLGQSPVEQNRARLLGRLVYREILTDEDADDLSEICGLQSPCRQSSCQSD